MATLANVLRQHGPAHLAKHLLSTPQAKAWRGIVACRTAALGGQQLACDACGHSHWQYHSCRNRHCPQCGARAKDAWLEGRLAEVLPVPYAHLVSTLPHSLNALYGAHPRWVIDTLFACAAQTLTEFAANPRWMGCAKGKPAFSLVLHSWTQELLVHLHVHAVMACGVLAQDGNWNTPARKPNFLFPERALSAVHRGKFLGALRAAHQDGRIEHDPQGGQSAWRERLRALYRHDWVVYAKTPLGGPAEPDPEMRTPRSAESVVHGRPVRSLATNRNRPAVVNALLAMGTMPQLAFRSRRASAARIGPAARTQATSACVACCTSQQRNTHSTESREVRYRWHPWFGRSVWVHETRIREGQGFVRCALTPELGAAALEIAAWMFDAGVCGLMNLANEPVVVAGALRELAALLKHAIRNSTTAGPVLQAEHLDISSEGGAHVNCSEAAATGDPTDIVPTGTQRAGLGVSADRDPTAGPAVVGQHASRPRHASGRRARGAGGSR